MANRIVYFNGEFVPESEARVSIFDSALMFGDMAFEMTRTFGQKAFRLDDHLDRLYASLKLLEIDCGLSIDQMRQITLDTLARNLPTEADDVDWQIMHDISRGPIARYRSIFPKGLRPTISINCWPLVSTQGNFAGNYESGVDLGIPSQLAVPAYLIDPKAKTRSRLHYQMASLQAARMGNVWPVMLDTDGFLTEGNGWNLFLVRDGKIYSPEPRNILLGVTRRVTIELADKLGIEVSETNLGRMEALQADEIFCTSTPFVLLHARSFEGQLVGDGGLGPVCQRLMDAWRELAGIDFVAQARAYEERWEEWERNDS